MNISKKQGRQRIHYRIRKKVTGTATRPRLSVYRSNKEIYCQLIDDSKGITVASASSRMDGVDKGGKKVEVASAVGKLIGKIAQEQNISEVVFDRGGYLYHGRVKALAEGARESGLKF